MAHAMMREIGVAIRAKRPICIIPKLSPWRASKNISGMFERVVGSPLKM